MPQSLAEYAHWLADRNLRWPAPPKREPVRAEPHADPIPGIRVVLWNLYGTLLRVADGELLHETPDKLRMEVALDKTIREFNMWYSMTRKPGAPWEYMYRIYHRIVEDLKLAGTRRKGDVPEVNSAHVWRKVLDKLVQKEYEYDVAQYGDLDELSEKIALFYHQTLQGHEAAPEAARTVTTIADAGLYQSLLADAQCFSVAQLLSDLRDQEPTTPLATLFRSDLWTLSYLAGVRKPSMSLFAAAYRKVKSLGLEPEQVLYISSRVAGDLAIAKSVGFHTAIYAGEKLGLSLTAADLQDADTCPDRLLTAHSQVRDVLGI